MLLSFQRWAFSAIASCNKPNAPPPRPKSRGQVVPRVRIPGPSLHPEIQARVRSLRARGAGHTRPGQGLSRGHSRTAQEQERRGVQGRVQVARESLGRREYRPRRGRRRGGEEAWRGAGPARGLPWSPARRRTGTPGGRLGNMAAGATRASRGGGGAHTRKTSLLLG